MSESESTTAFRSKHSTEHLGEQPSIGRASRRIRTIVQRAKRHIHRHICKFGIAVRALFPIKPALHLSQLEGCSERGAQYQIDGERKPTAKAIHAIDGELLS